MRTRIASIALSAVLLAALLVAYFAFRIRAQAQDPDDPPPADGDAEPITETAEPNPTIEPGPTPRDPFTPYPADDGALTWEELSADEQAGAEAMQEWAETANGAAVHNAFAVAAATTSAMREVEAAQTASGLDGIETLGVVP